MLGDTVGDARRSIDLALRIILEAIGCDTSSVAEDEDEGCCCVGGGGEGGVGEKACSPGEGGGGVTAIRLYDLDNIGFELIVGDVDVAHNVYIDLLRQIPLSAALLLNQLFWIFLAVVVMRESFILVLIISQIIS
jgi:hypothetical protein